MAPNIGAWIARAKTGAKPYVQAASSKAKVGLGVAVAGVATYAGAKGAYGVVNESIFEPYSMQHPRSVSTEGSMPGEPMLFAPTMRERYRKGMTPGEFADNGDLTLSLNNLRRG